MLTGARRDDGSRFLCPEGPKSGKIKVFLKKLRKKFLFSENTPYLCIANLKKKEASPTGRVPRTKTFYNNENF
jgi:hypothetical protein